MVPVLYRENGQRGCRMSALSQTYARRQLIETDATWRLLRAAVPTLDDAEKGVTIGE